MVTELDWDGSACSRQMTPMEIALEERAQDGLDAKPAAKWPPRHGPGIDLISLFKRAEAIGRRGKLVWLRDVDEVHTLAVAYEDSEGQLIAHRQWPNHRPIILNEDGTVKSKDDGKVPYCKHWIAARDTDMIYMLMQNSDTYLELGMD
jgi:hypothetical protein